MFKKIIVLFIFSLPLKAEMIKIPHFERFLNQPQLEISFSFYPTQFQYSKLVNLLPKTIPFEITLNHLTNKPLLSGKIGQISFEYSLKESLLNTWHFLKIALNFQTQTLTIFFNDQIIIQQTNLTRFECQPIDLIIGGYRDLEKDYQFIGKINDLKPHILITMIESDKKELWFLFSLITLIPLSYYYRQRSLRAFLKQPSLLFTYPIQEIPIIYKKLSKYKQFNKILHQLNLKEDDFKRVIFFVKNDNPLHRCHFLFKKLPCKIQPIQEKLNGFFYIEFTEEFPLNLHHLYIYFPHKKLTLFQIIEQLQQYYPFETILIVNLSDHFETKDYLMINPTNLTEWLLNKNPLMIFCHLLATFIELKQLSPFQNYGTIHLKNVFLTRQPILKKLLANPFQNYALIGGRQLGKTSILKFLVHYYQKSPNIICHYIILHNQQFPNILELIAVEKIQLFLIDEADDFIAHEKATNYPILGLMQQLSLQRKAFFIFAGHWELYNEWKTLNSPYRYFAQHLMVESFDVIKAQKFIVKSLSYLNRSFKNQELTIQLIQTINGRPNLVIAACQILLTLEKSNIEETDLKIVFSQLKVNLLSHLGLSDLENEQILEKTVIITALFSQRILFSTEDLLKTMEHFGFFPQVNLIQITLEHLSLSGILIKENSHYVLGIPLLKETFSQESLSLLLAQTITRLKSCLESK